MASITDAGEASWCLDRGVSEVTWTFDPPISRNALPEPGAAE